MSDEQKMGSQEQSTYRRLRSKGSPVCLWLGPTCSRCPNAAGSMQCWKERVSYLRFLSNQGPPFTYLGTPTAPGCADIPASTPPASSPPEHGDPDKPPPSTNTL